MPPKGKAAQKPKGTDSSKASSSVPIPTPSAGQTTAAAAPSSSSTVQTAAAAAVAKTPTTVAERSQQRYDDSRPFDAARRKHGFASLSRDQQVAWVSCRFARSPPAARARLPAKAQRELWRHVNEATLPIRALRTGQTTATTTRTTVTTAQPAKDAPPWGRDRAGQDVGNYSFARFDERTARRTALTVLEVASRLFREKRERAARGIADPVTGDETVVTESEVDEERQRRAEMAALRKELYGAATGSFAVDPEWDDVVPVPLVEPEGALAAISYPAEYAEAISYLRAVMIKKEYSPRCLRLTETIIAMNPAHYTVWLYRASNILAMKLPIPDEMEWLNGVALEHLKNYQIWHHRHLLIDNYYPGIAGDPAEVARLADSEREFLAKILSYDTKNYHVWSYRSYLVEKLDLWDNADELAAVERMVDDDVRNNSAWSHRFFLVFSDPAKSTLGVAATEPDPRAPPDVVDREVAYAQAKIRMAPQNQSPWNYLRGVLVKGGRKLGEAEPFAAGFVDGLGAKDGSEDVRSTHALDLLAEIFAEKGDKERADLCLRRLGEKWDRIRIGYWEWRRKCLETA